MKRNMIFFASFLLLVSYAVAVLVHVFLPHSELNIWLSSQLFLAQFYAFPILFGGVLVSIGLLWSIYSYRRIQKKKQRVTRLFFWPSITVLSIILMFDPTPMWPVVKNNEPIIKIVEWNTLNEFNTTHATKIFQEFNADIAIFPELTSQKLTQALQETGLSLEEYQIFSSPKISSNIAPVTVVTKKSFATYQSVSSVQATTFGTVILHAESGNAPDIIGIHTAPPLPQLMDYWRNDLEQSSHILAQFPNAIVGGDFNATLRHASLNQVSQHIDSTQGLNPWERGTWPLKFPQWARTSIDHVYLPQQQYIVNSIRTDDFSESDHVALFIEISANR